MIITVISECIDHVRVDVALLCIPLERDLFISLIMKVMLIFIFNGGTQMNTGTVKWFNSERLRIYFSGRRRRCIRTLLSNLR